MAETDIETETMVLRCSLPPGRKGDATVSPSSCSIVADSLAVIARLLSTSRSDRDGCEFPSLQEFNPATAEDGGGNRSGGSNSSCVPPPEYRVSCPGLSLHHKKLSPHSFIESSSDHSADRKLAKGHAINLLARPLESESALRRAENDRGADDTELEATMPPAIARSARTLLRNFSSSFAVLIDSRLRAYTDFLSRHAMTLLASKTNWSARTAAASTTTDADAAEHRVPRSVAAARAIEEKLALILAKGAQVAMTAVALRFELPGDVSTMFQDESIAAASLLNLVVSMDFVVPRARGSSELQFSVSFSTPGMMTGTSIIVLRCCVVG